MNAVGHCFERAICVDGNDFLAARCFTGAAERGLADGQFNLGTMFYGGRGVALSDEAAVKWWTLAGTQGHAQALFNLGHCHAAGIGVPVDGRKAFECFRKAAEKGLEDAA
ncbi:hypothetical protein M885DRAFT_444833, partial [Pelagophyceae sp. CCMP2097]